MVGGAIIAASSLAVCRIVSSEAITLTHAHIQVADVVSLDCIAPERRHRVGAIAIATAPEGERRFTRRALRTLMARRAPELATATLGGGANAIVVRRPRSMPATTPCFRSTRAISAHMPISAGELTPTPCQPAYPAIADYDPATSRLSAHGDIASGAYLGRIDAPPAAPDEGAPVALNVVVGSVRVTRQVTALQSGARSQRIFVRDDDGGVFRIAVPRGAP